MTHRPPMRALWSMVSHPTWDGVVPPGREVIARYIADEALDQLERIGGAASDHLAAQPDFRSVAVVVGTTLGLGPAREAVGRFFELNGGRGSLPSAAIDVLVNTDAADLVGAMTVEVEQVQVLSMACASGVAALASARGALSSTGASHCLVVTYDCLVSGLARRGFERLGVLASEDGCHEPRDLVHETPGVSLAPGFAATILTTSADGEAAWEVEQVVALVDDNSRMAPDRRAIVDAVARLRAGDDRPVTGVLLHASGTRPNLDNELAAFDEVLVGTRRLALKGRLGHTLAASGLLEIIAAADQFEPGDRWIKAGFGFGGTIGLAQLHVPRKRTGGVPGPAS